MPTHPAEKAPLNRVLAAWIHTLNVTEPDSPTHSRALEHIARAEVLLEREALAVTVDRTRSRPNRLVVRVTTRFTGHEPTHYTASVRPSLGWGVAIKLHPDPANGLDEWREAEEISHVTEELHEAMLRWINSAAAPLASTTQPPMWSLPVYQILALRLDVMGHVQRMEAERGEPVAYLTDLMASQAGSMREIVTEHLSGFGVIVRMDTEASRPERLVLHTQMVYTDAISSPMIIEHTATVRPSMIHQVRVVTHASEEQGGILQAWRRKEAAKTVERALYHRLTALASYDPAARRQG